MTVSSELVTPLLIELRIIIIIIKAITQKICNYTGMQSKKNKNYPFEKDFAIYPLKPPPPPKKKKKEKPEENKKEKKMEGERPSLLH